MRRTHMRRTPIGDSQPICDARTYMRRTDNKMKKINISYMRRTDMNMKKINISYMRRTDMNMKK